MNYIFENIGNLDKASFTIESGKVNLKYGFNGIGKTTLVKAIKYAFGDDQVKSSLNNILLSYRTGKEPVFPHSLKTDFSDLLIFDKSYFDKLFRQTDFLNNTYDLIIEGDEYRRLLEPIADKISSIKNIINSSNYIELFNIMNNCSGKEIIKYKSDGKTAIKSGSILFLYASKNIQITADIPSELSDYSIFIKSGFRSEWYKWINAAKDNWYDKENKCPFCGFSQPNPIKERITALKALKDKGEYSEYDKEQSFVGGVSNFIDGELGVNISSINDLDSKADLSIIKPLEEGITFLQEENEKIKYFLALEAKKLIESKNKGTYDTLAAEFKSKKLSSKLKLCDHDGNRVVDIINYTIDELISSLENLREYVGKLNNQIKDKIESNKKLINDFLKISGMPYIVDIKQEGDTRFETLFSYRGNPNIIPNQLSYLSYGEANALALLLFCLEAKNKENALIVFDDPVSSFDNNKRYAIYDYIFNNISGKKLLWNKTCVILTHDFDSIVVFSKCFPLGRQDITRFSYLSLENFELIERPFSNEDITNTFNVYSSIAKDNSRPIISRITAARHCCEIKGSKGSDEYNILSSLIHKREKPTKDEKGDLEYTNEEINLVSDTMKNIFGNDYNYNNFLNALKDTKALKETYSKSTSKLDKLCIARFILSDLKGKDVENNVIWNFLSEVYHIEKDTIHTISNYEIFDVPDYIIAMCDSLISQK